MSRPMFNAALALSLSTAVLAAATPALAQYGGAESDAAWRATAETMIDQNRKADLTINVLDQFGNAIPDAQVHVLQTKQAYQFGSAVSVNQILGYTSDDAIYRQKFEELFNTATIENSLKWVPLEGEWGSSYSLGRAIQTLDYLNARGIDNRGHVLLWPGWSNLPTYLQSYAGNPTALRQEIYDHIDEVAGAVGDRVVEWDVINEPRTNNDLMGIFGDSILVDAFNRADAATNAQMFINEYNIITQDGNWWTRQQYLNTINYLLNSNINLDGIGMQGHFNANSLTGITDVWSILDQFYATGVPITITEYDLVPDPNASESEREALKANYLRDFLTAVFAHPGTEGFMLWGFWEGRHWRPDAAMFNLDWSETPMLQVWEDLVLDQFMTDETLDTNALGQALLRAFHGQHTIEVTVDVQTYYETVSLDATGTTLDITLPIGALPGDLNGDGFVGLDDLDIVLAAWNQSVPPADSIADPSGDGFVGLDDLDIILNNWNNGTPPVAVIPEPAGIALLSSTGLLHLRRRYSH